MSDGMKRWISASFLLIPLVLLLILTESRKSTETNQVENRRYTIGISLPHTENPYRNAMKSLLEEAYGEGSSDDRRADILIYDGEKSQKKQNEDLLEMIRMRVDAIVLVPATYDGPISMVKYAGENGIPVIVVDDDLDMTQGAVVTSRIAANNIQTGYQAAQLLLEGVEKKYPEEPVWNVIELTGMSDVSSVISRTQGRVEAFLNLENVNLLGSYVAGYERAHAKSIVEDCLNIQKDIHGILCQNDLMALGAYDALKEAHMLDKVVVVGIDGQREVWNRIMDGFIYGTVVQQPEMVCQGVEIACDYLDGKYVEEVYYQETVSITLENVREEMLKGTSWIIE